MDSTQPSGNLSNTLSIIAKYEELAHAHLIELDIENHTMLLNPQTVPTKEPARSKWLYEARLYFAFKGAGDFNFEKDVLKFKDKHSLHPIAFATADGPVPSHNAPR
jgi:hypothetical protein